MTTVADALVVAVRSHQAGNLRQAEQIYRQVLVADPANADALHLLGVMACQIGKHDVAIGLIEKALTLRPREAVFHCNLGAAYQALGLLAKASIHFRAAVRRNPNHAEAHNNLAATLTDQGKFDEAESCLRRALRLKPDFPDAQANLGKLLGRIGKMEEAAIGYHHAIQRKPASGIRLAAALLLPPIYQSVEEIEKWRMCLADNVRHLGAEGFVHDLTYEAAPTPFFLAYQGQNDRELQRDIVRLSRPPRLEAMQPGRQPLDDKIHVAYISKNLRDHTIGHLMRGTIAHLSRTAFDVTVFSVGNHRDEEALWIKQHADQYVELPANLPECRRLVRERGLNILVYPDLGMDPVTYTLAFSRLAPVQCVTWGHPVTTGIETIDYFLSSDDLEIDGAESHYSEKLVRLKHLPVCYYRPEMPVPRKDRAAFGLSASAHVYACPQTLFKFHPDFDAVLAGILRADPLGVLVLIHGQSRHWDEMLMKRWQGSMPDVVDRIRFVPPQNRGAFLCLNAAADALLDPIHFGGGNTSYEALALGVPIVTWPSSFLRGRITWALYQQMNVLDCVAATPADYVRIAVRLGTDAGYRETVRAKILAANDVLFENVAGVRELEEFFLRVGDASRKRHYEVTPGSAVAASS